MSEKLIPSDQGSETIHRFMYDSVSKEDTDFLRSVKWKAVEGVGMWSPETTSLSFSSTSVSSVLFAFKIDADAAIIHPYSLLKMKVVVPGAV